MPNVYNRAKLLHSPTSLAAAALQALLLQDGLYTYDPDHNFVTDLVPATAELSVGGYSRQALAGLVAAQDDANNRAVVTANEVVFAGLAAGQTVGAMVVFVNTGADATSVLVGYYRQLPVQATTGSSMTFRFDGTTPGDLLRVLEG